jgi:hypothetical protein
MRGFILTAMLGASSFAAASERPPLQGDFGRCANAIQNSGRGADLQGALRMELLVRRDGRVYAAFIAGERGIDNRQLERCLTNMAVLWQLPEVPIDYERTFAPISFTPGGSDTGGSTESMTVGSGQMQASVMQPDINNPPPWEPINVQVAQQTLDVSELATIPEHGIASLAVKDYPTALQTFRDALARTPEDPVALRGMVQALVETNGNLAEARGLAERLVKIDPSSVAGHEAMIRVCIAQKDAACLGEHWKAAMASKDFAPRSRMFREQLQTPVQQAVADARKAPAAAPAAQQQDAQQDECVTAPNDEARAICFARRCLDAGSAQYAKELSEQNKIDYVAGQWRAKPAGTGRMVVTREISTNTKPPQEHNPMWILKLGEQVTMMPANAEARQITLTHNACASRVTAGK